MHLGFADAGNDAPTSTTRKAYDLMADGYGPGTNGPFQVVVDADGGKLPATTLERRHDRSGRPARGGLGGRAGHQPAGDLAIITVTPTTSPQDARTSDLLQHLRADTIPAAVAGSDVHVSVTGSTALTVDVSSRLQQRMAWFLGAVIGLSFLVLMVVFRSVLVPLKAAALNVLGVAAAYGVVVAVFQWGWGASLIGVHETVPIMPLAPMLMFAILFGLSMDYEVFLMSRVREQYRKHLDPQPGRDRGRRHYRTGHHQRRAHHDQRVRLVHPRRRRHDQDVRHRPVSRRLPGRDAGPDDPGPGGNEPARSPGLVAASVARPSPADDRHRRRRARR